MHLHTEIYPNLKSISELFKMYMKSILASRDNWVSRNQTLGCLRLYGESRVSQAQPRISAYEILLQYDWLLFFSRHSLIGSQKHTATYTDRLLAAGNNSGADSELTIGILASQDPPLFMSNGWGNKRVAQEWIFDPWLVKLEPFIDQINKHNLNPTNAIFRCRSIDQPTMHG